MDDKSDRVNGLILFLYRSITECGTRGCQQQTETSADWNRLRTDVSPFLVPGAEIDLMTREEPGACPGQGSPEARRQGRRDPVQRDGSGPSACATPLSPGGQPEVLSRSGRACGRSRSRAAAVGQRVELLSRTRPAPWPSRRDRLGTEGGLRLANRSVQVKLSCQFWFGLSDRITSSGASRCSFQEGDRETERLSACRTDVSHMTCKRGRALELSEAPKKSKGRSEERPLSRQHAAGGYLKSTYHAICGLAIRQLQDGRTAG